jgi:hypothetical protein
VRIEKRSLLPFRTLLTEFDRAAAVRFSQAISMVTQ